MKRLAPILILLLAIGVTVGLYTLRPEPSEVAPERPATKVEAMSVQPESVLLTVDSQGTVLPKIETELAVEVSGRIIEMSPNFRAGGRFEEDDVLFRIDPADYEAAVAARAADLATAELGLAQEEALAEQAAADWAALGEGEASDLTLRKPQLAQASARIESAKAALKRAKRDLRRTEIRAPYDGRVLSKTVDLGQYVMANPANPVARIYATDTAEVRLPLAQDEIDYLIDPELRESDVTLHKEGASGRQEWSGRLVRFEATIDPSSRLTYAVAEVDAPFENGLRRGMFVTAEIEGRRLESAYVLPRYALRGSDSIYLVTPEKTLVTRSIEIVKTDAEQAILSGGLNPGDQVATSPIAYFVENMPVEIINND
ncbi:efflux transporter periplasmic adaptor subunit [Coraliomargarita sinensis]|uniref:Efflux transporter periplasmic adaptor subunit n=1 Tax=Coraliomargarita sinensis TaxID=2174842 RepID=A0A317ZKW3_9BACT|nr:efflux RND transporter periplasmic adaptor subunit [Coraliomargarita sinensis]PXA04578.1 efflux transporter periplasmic adaptor subunit [Coraliomargarita sinensis]